MSRPLLATALASCALAACSATPAALETPRDPVGRVHAYLRSNQDGSLPERVVVYRESATRAAVYKMVERCTNAAYVTAEFDLARGEALRLVGGRLTRESTQDGVATLTLDPEARTLTTHVALPDGGEINETLSGVASPWRIYDFDLADLTTLMEGAPAPRGDFVFTVALAWPAETEGPFVTNRGQAHARFDGEELRRQHASLRYQVSGALNGQLWLDAREGYVVEARFDEPNHPGYDDFSLVLEGVVEAAEGPAAWAETLAAHWRGCP
ncbi:MAG: hypothetical protein AB7O98_02310 [Hyphomonadaceae bacterium]